MTLMETLLAAHALTGAGWDTDGPADMATWVSDASGQEVVVFDTGNEKQDVANASFVALAHQAMPFLAEQFKKMNLALERMEEFCRETSFADAQGVSNSALPEQLETLKLMCSEARKGFAKTSPLYEFRVNIPQATAEIRAALAENYPTKAQAVRAANTVLSDTGYERAIIFRIELDRDGHVTEHEVSQYVMNPTQGISV